MKLKIYGLIAFILFLSGCSGNNHQFGVKVHELKIIAGLEQMLSIQSKDNKINGYSYFVEDLGAILIIAQNDSANIQMIGCELSVQEDFQKGVDQIMDLAEELGDTTAGFQREFTNWLNQSIEIKKARAVLKNSNLKFEIKQYREETISIYILPN
ncbi:MAG: hypothetical protein JXQ65_11305 [Candidatus Marinimicrobia bacterium]|nr:hypothetical protein [Candidatus Neomarinimicrobiota bacterium]